MNYDLSSEQKAELLEVATFLSNLTQVKLDKAGITLDCDSVFYHDADRSEFVCDIGSLVAYMYWHTPIDVLKTGGRLAAFAVWHERTGLDGSFYEAFCDLDEVWDADIAATGVTVSEYGEALLHFIRHLPSPFSWSRLIEERRADEMLDEDEDDVDG